MKCTFFGHSNTRDEILPKLESVLINLIENNDVDVFYVGNHGNFDFMVKKTLKKLKLNYPHIDYSVVLAYMPGEKDELAYKDYTNTIYPGGLESTPPKYAICKRNIWMIDRSDYVVSYVEHSIGGAAQFKKLAEKKGKVIINLAHPD